MRIIPIPHPLSAAVHVPGSKSLTNRALLIASLASGTTRLTNALFADDSRYFAQALQSLGFDLHLDESSRAMTVTGLGGNIPASKAELYIGNAGTAARFLSAFLTLAHGEYILDGDARMRERPIGDLVDALTQLGANLQPFDPSAGSGQCSAQGQPSFSSIHPASFIMHPSKVCPPIKITANGLRGGKTKIAGDISSQFLSALLMIAPYAQSPIEIELTTELNSKPYVDMTIAVMRDFGVEVQRDGYRAFKIFSAKYGLDTQADRYTGSHATRNTRHSPITNYPIESDASAASYFFAAPAICGGSVTVENISRKSQQGDIAFLDVLSQMGCVVTESDNSITVQRPSSILGIDVDMRDIPDTAQTLAAIAPFASSPTRIRGIASARLKETDRVHAACVELTRLGVRVEEHEDGMTIYPAETMRPAFVHTYNDHRMAMAFSLVGLHCDGVTIENPACVSKTFPNFFAVLDSLR